MFNKIGFSLFTILLLSTSASFSMHNDRAEQARLRLQKKHQKGTQGADQRLKTALPVPQQTQEQKRQTVQDLQRTTAAKTRTKQALQRVQYQYTPEQEMKFNAILSLYEERAAHHKYMKKTITKYRKNPLDNFWNIFGVSTDVGLTNDDSGIPVDKVIEGILKSHADDITLYQTMENGRRQSFSQREQPFFALIANIYYRTIVHSNEAIQKLEYCKNKCTEEEYNTLLIVKEIKDKLNFHRSVQKMILEEFEPNQDVLFSQLVAYCRENLKPSAFDALLPKSAKTKQFCEDVVNRRYNFPSLESFSDLTLSVESEEEMEQTENPITIAIAVPTDVTTDSQTMSAVPSLEATEEKSEEFPLYHSLTPEEHADMAKQRHLEIAGAPLEVDQDGLAQHNYTQALSEVDLPEDSNSQDVEKKVEDDNNIEASEFVPTALEDLFRKDRAKKVAARRNGKSKALAKPTVSITEKTILGISERKEELLRKILNHPISTNLLWANVVSLFNSPSGFKGKVYGTDGSTNTFEVYLKFYQGIFAGFLFEDEFKALTKGASRELLKDRNFLPNNKRLRSWKVSPETSIATSFFTLHNPHPNHYLYESLVKRLQKQLCLLGITLETLGDL